MTKHLFFLGKGGVGKSTLSAVEGLTSAGQGRDTLIVSMDPAHNQSDIFENTFSEKPKKVTDHLKVIEINLDQQIKKYLHGIESKIKQTYQYLTAFNLGNNFDIIRYSPGIEEYAILQAYDDIISKFNKKDLIIFDMPPTALSLKFFSLPKLSLLWLEKLLAMRNQIIEKKQIITKIKIGDKSFETDKITKNLREQIETYLKMNQTFQNEKIAQIVLVMNPDKLSINESVKIRERLQTLKMDAGQVIINKYQNQDKNIFKPFMNADIRYYPTNITALIGLNNLENYLKQID